MGPTMTAFFEKRQAFYLRFYFSFPGMVEGIQLNVVDRPILWHTAHSSPISKAKESLSSTLASENQIE